MALSGLINDLKKIICKQECWRVSDITIAAVVGEKLHIGESVFYKTAKFLNDENFAMLVQSHIKGSLLIHNSSVNDTSVLLDAIKKSYRASTNNNCPPFEFGDNGTNKMKP
jgi:putative IMPACT (imprinted ancient) family translation regulator